MSQESQQAFDANKESIYAIAGMEPIAAFNKGWHASRESLKQKLLSDEMVERVARSFACCSGNVKANYRSLHNQKKAKAALQAVVGKL